MLKSITLKILECVARSVLTCDDCKETLSYWGRDYLKKIANENGWRYDEYDDRVYCFSCQEKNKNKEV
ncbi:MAG: hypothetical protein DDT40_01536 [candidate division WS2 bacterium]|nr:hypothetical protein [Candidatus Psychracetigena formicireducens]